MNILKVTDFKQHKNKKYINKAFLSEPTNKINHILGMAPGQCVQRRTNVAITQPIRTVVIA